MLCIQDNKNYILISDGKRTIEYRNGVLRDVALFDVNKNPVKIASEHWKYYDIVKRIEKDSD